MTRAHYFEQAMPCGGQLFSKSGAGKSTVSVCASLESSGSGVEERRIGDPPKSVGAKQRQRGGGRASERGGREKSERRNDSTAALAVRLSPVAWRCVCVSVCLIPSQCFLNRQHSISMRRAEFSSHLSTKINDYLDTSLTSTTTQLLLFNNSYHYYIQSWL